MIEANSLTERARQERNALVSVCWLVPLAGALLFTTVTAPAMASFTGVRDRSEANKQMLDQTDQIQDKTKEALARIQKQAVETESLGAQTLEELRRQGQQLDDIDAELNHTEAQLKHSKRLQNKFDWWAGNWLGGKKAAAIKEAKHEIAMNSSTEVPSVRTVFENEKYETLSGKWKAAGVVLCSDPTIPASDVFNPQKAHDGVKQIGADGLAWVIDYSMVDIDAEGWTYAYDFASLNKAGSGKSAKDWNTYVRRRKWIVEEKKDKASSTIGSIRERQQARHAATAVEETAGSAVKSTGKKEKVGYVPRDKVNLQASGLTSAGMMHSRGALFGAQPDPSQDLDDETAARLSKVKQTDAVIDRGVDDISRTIDNLARIAGDMGSEARRQNAQIDRVDKKLQHVNEEQIVVNARMKSLLKHS